MKKYYVLACCEVMEIGQPVSEWEFYENIIPADGNKPGAWEIVSEDYYLNRDGSRKGKARVRHTHKDKVITGEYETVKEAFEDLDKLESYM